VSPPLSWIGAPATTKSFVLVMDDPDAPSAQPWVHWIIFKIPKDTNALPEGINVVENPPMQHGQNSWKLVQYDGPQPPLGQTHLYVFTLYALDTMDITNLEGGEENGATYHRTPVPTKDILLRAISGHILDQAQWTGRFQQSSR
jgi:Raf kinase inhibitor-like YbhB/YbcL family protein